MTALHRLRDKPNLHSFLFLFRCEQRFNTVGRIDCWVPFLNKRRIAFCSDFHSTTPCDVYKTVHKKGNNHVLLGFFRREFDRYQSQLIRPFGFPSPLPFEFALSWIYFSIWPPNGATLPSTFRSLYLDDRWLWLLTTIIFGFSFSEFPFV